MSVENIGKIWDMCRQSRHMSEDGKVNFVRRELSQALREVDPSLAYECSSVIYPHDAEHVIERVKQRILHYPITGLDVEFWAKCIKACGYYHRIVCDTKNEEKAVLSWLLDSLSNSDEFSYFVDIFGAALKALLPGVLLYIDGYIEETPMLVIVAVEEETNKCVTRYHNCIHWVYELYDLTSLDDINDKLLQIRFDLLAALASMKL